MSEDHRLYSALPALISGQCGRESGREHAAVIQTTLDGVAKSGLQTISITSDGESRRGEALIHLTFKKHLETTSPIYPALSILALMNLEVGDNDKLLRKKPCSYCGGELPEQPQCLLKHIGAHIPFDPKVDTTLEPCGLCLRLAQCAFYLKKGRGAQNGQQINYKNSHCPSMVRLTYSIAEKSMMASPCSNMPMKCLWYVEAALVVWQYNLKGHIKSKHPYVSLPDHESLWKIRNTERKAMRSKWDDRKKVKKKRVSKSKAAAPLVVSAAHSLCLTLVEP